MTNICSIYLGSWQKAWSTPSSLAPLLPRSKSPPHSFSASRFSWKLSFSACFSFTSGCPLYPCPRLCFAPFPGQNPLVTCILVASACICLARMNWPFDPHLRPTFHTYLGLITNFYFWSSKAHYSLNTRWSSFFFLSNYDFSKINFSSNNDDI